MTRRNRWRQNDPWETVALIAGLGAFVGAGVAVGGALFFADRRVSGVEGTVESLDRRVSRLERENGMTAGNS
jgi:hypothetical protein